MDRKQAMATASDTARAQSAPHSTPLPVFLDLIGASPASRARWEQVVAQHEAEFEAARLADEAAGYLDLADEPSPSALDYKADLAASFSQVA
jgi:hypothetical protein